MQEWLPVLIDISKAGLAVLVVQSAYAGAALSVLAGGISGMVYWFSNAGWAVKNLGFILRYFATTSLGSMLLNPMMLVAAAIGGLVYLWSKENRMLQESKDRVDQYSASLKGLTKAQLDNYQQQLKLYMLELSRKEEALRAQLPASGAGEGGFEPDVQGSVFDMGVAKRLDTVLRFKEETTKLLGAVDKQFTSLGQAKVDAPVAFKGASEAIDKVKLKTQELQGEMAKLKSPTEAGRLAIERFIQETVKDIPLDKYPKLAASIKDLRNAYDELTMAQNESAKAEADVINKSADGEKQLAWLNLAMQQLTYSYEDGRVSVSDYYEAIRNAITKTGSLRLAEIEQQRSVLKNEGDDLKKRAELDREAAKIKADVTSQNLEQTRKEQLAIRDLASAYVDAHAKMSALKERATPGGSGEKVQARYDAALTALDASHVKELESYKRMTDAQLSAATGFHDRLAALDSIRAQQQEERNVLEQEQSLRRFDDLMAEASAYGNVQLALETLMGQEGERQASLLNQQEEIQLYEQIWQDANEGIWQSVGSLYDSMKNGLSDILVGIVTGAGNAMQVVAGLGKMLLKIVADYLAQKVMAWLFEKALMATQVATAIAAATAVAAALVPIQAAVAAGWAPAAISASIATLGVAAVEGVTTYLASLTAGMAAAATMQQTASVLGGAAHAGLDYVPEDKTFLLKAGERVVSPQQNTDLTEFLAGQTKAGSGVLNLSIDIDGEPFFRIIQKGLRDGRLKLAPV